MDFSQDAFQRSSFSGPSSDTMDHSKMVMACRFGWSANAGPPTSPTAGQGSQASHVSTPPTTLSSPFKVNNRFAPCRGRLYHQLACSHRIRTDLVEDCGTNCLDPLAETPALAFYCHECVEKEASDIWIARESEHNALYPQLSHMSKEQYEQWYNEHRQLEAQFSKDRKIYEMNLKSKTRPSNTCSTVQTSSEEMDFASELDSLSLAMASTRTGSTSLITPRETRINLPTDVSEQLHWSLNSLSLDRGSCGVEYSPALHATRPKHRSLDDDELWGKTRDRR